jgi:uncharacterized surface protein with fasciclin (FAS1) repeats
VTITCSKNKVLQGITRLRLYVCILKFKNKNMKKTSILFAFLMSSLFAIAQQKDIVDIAIASKDHTTLVAAVKAADLVGTLKGEGPFTVFAPTNAAFDKLPAGTVASLLKPESKATLSGILTYHVVAGNVDAAAVLKAIKAGKGKAVFTTVNGATLTATLKGKNVVLTDAKGGQAIVIATDLAGSNGMVHVIDAVLIP